MARELTLLALLCIVLPGCIGEGSGSQATAIPRIADPPFIDGQLNDSAWNEAAVWHGAFEIATDPVLAGSFPLTLRVAADDHMLYVAARVSGLPPNAYYTQIGNETGVGPEWLRLLLTPGAGPLSPPAHGLYAGNYRGEATTAGVLYWNGASWQPLTAKVDFAPDEPHPREGRRARTAAEGDDLTWEFLVSRRSADLATNSFDLPGAGEFGLRLQLIRQGDPAVGGPEDRHTDVYPPAARSSTGPLSEDGWLALRFA